MGRNGGDSVEGEVDALGGAQPVIVTTAEGKRMMASWSRQVAGYKKFMPFS